MSASRAPAASLALLVVGWSALYLLSPSAALAQAGPPFLSNDPGTPGNTNWEINLAVAPSVGRDDSDYQLPQFDLNYGLGDRIQLTYEIPYVLASSKDEPQHTGWGNGVWGVKWRFLDQGDDGWQASIFPQLETGGSSRAQANGVAAIGPRYLLPVQVTRKLGPLDVDLEVGEYFGGHGPRERIIGLVAGHAVSPRLELDVELYDDRAEGALPHETTLDVGGRYKLRPGLIALFMMGRSVSSTNPGTTPFFGYFGIQILLSHYGLALNTSDP